jgi:hypothetical protein
MRARCIRGQKSGFNPKPDKIPRYNGKMKNKRTSASASQEQPRLPYPTVPRKHPGNPAIKSEEYIIPPSDKGKVLKEMYPFVGVPKLSAKLLDIEENKRFVVKDFKVVRELGRNWLASPYYYSSGGTVIDWW